MIAGLDAAPIGRVTSVQSINRSIARILSQWRDDTATGPLWFGRNRRPEAVIFPGDLGKELADAAVGSIDLDLAAELQLRNASPRLKRAELSTLEDDQLRTALALKICRAGVHDLIRLRDHAPEHLEGLLEHLKRGPADAAATRVPEVTRRIAHRDTATWISYWSSRDDALLALIPAPHWLCRLVASGPQEPDAQAGEQEN
ncbi:hypothetical protein ACIA49_39005 [Kribbella sp. NPDC051587]|uniref:hypothetical protein n=1 Tax=Kribbella sp. NPDC051587 TaxID=3364119 RepID=UPI0037B3A8CA